MAAQCGGGRVKSGLGWRSTDHVRRDRSQQDGGNAESEGRPYATHVVGVEWLSAGVVGWRRTEHVRRDGPQKDFIVTRVLICRLGLRLDPRQPPREELRRAGGAWSWASRVVADVAPSRVPLGLGGAHGLRVGAARVGGVAESKARGGVAAEVPGVLLGIRFGRAASRDGAGHV